MAIETPKAKGRNGSFVPTEISRSSRRCGNAYFIEVRSKRPARTAPIQLLLNEEQRALLVEALNKSPGMMVILDLTTNKIKEF